MIFRSVSRRKQSVRYRGGFSPGIMISFVVKEIADSIFTIDPSEMRMTDRSQDLKNDVVEVPVCLSDRVSELKSLPDEIEVDIDKDDLIQGTWYRFAGKDCPQAFNPERRTIADFVPEVMDSWKKRDREKVLSRVMPMTTEIRKKMDRMIEDDEIKEFPPLHEILVEI